MIEKLRRNFMLANVFARILLVLTFVFANWQNFLSATILVLGYSNLLLALISAFGVGVGLSFLIPVLINVLLGWARILSVPRAEFCLIGTAFFALGMLLCGLFNLTHLFTPLFLTWGSVIFPFVALTVAMVCFYKLTSTLYFNDVTRPYYFKVCLIVYAALAVVVVAL